MFVWLKEYSRTQISNATVRTLPSGCLFPPGLFLCLACTSLRKGQWPSSKGSSVLTDAAVHVAACAGISSSGDGFSRRPWWVGCVLMLLSGYEGQCEREEFNTFYLALLTQQHDVYNVNIPPPFHLSFLCHNPCKPLTAPHQRSGLKCTCKGLTCKLSFKSGHKSKTACPKAGSEKVGEWGEGQESWELKAREKEGSKG